MVKKHNILIIQSGGREHAIGWKLRQSPKVDKIYFAPGTAGTELVGTNTMIQATDFQALISFAKENNIDITIATQDDILAQGVVNEFQAAGLAIFGATKEAAIIEASKAFSKQLMSQDHIPTAIYATFTKYDKALSYITDHPMPVVIKASGLALGKGVVIAQNIAEARKALSDAMIDKVFGAAGEEVVIEEYLEGKEISIHAFTDGNNFSLFPPSRDHKTIFDGNKGPNTGGMGTIAPVPGVTQNYMQVVAKSIVGPALLGMKKRGIPFKGLLYPGLSMTKNGPKVIEFNCRFGDPETESYMRLLKSDLFDVMAACVTGTLAKFTLEWEDVYACCIVLASAGYPGSYKKGEIIHGLDKVSLLDRDVQIFHFATKKENGQILTNGGRVLGVTAVGNTLSQALKKAYAVIGEHGVHFNGMQYRKDIGTI